MQGNQKKQVAGFRHYLTQKDDTNHAVSIMDHWADQAIFRPFEHFSTITKTMLCLSQTLDCAGLVASMPRDGTCNLR